MDKEKTDPRQYIKACNDFSVENVIKKPGYERFEIDFGDQKRGKHKRKNSLPARFVKPSRNIFLIYSYEYIAFEILAY